MDDLCPHDTIYSADPPPHPTVGAPGAAEGPGMLNQSRPTTSNELTLISAPPSPQNYFWFLLLCVVAHRSWSPT